MSGIKREQVQRLNKPWLPVGVPRRARPPFLPPTRTTKITIAPGEIWKPDLFVRASDSGF